MARLNDLILVAESGFACGKSKHVANGIPHLRPFNIGDEADLQLDEVYYVPAEEAPASKVGLCAGDILFNNTNSADLVGKVAYVPNELAVGFSNHLTRIRLNRDKVEPRFVAAYLHQLWRRGYFKRNCTQWVSQAAFNQQALRALEVPLPSLSEQRRIVDILNRANGIRQLRRQAQEKARQVIPALFAEMFGDPAENPMGWPTKHIGELVSVKPNYGTMERPSTEERKWLDLRVANIQDNQLDLRDRKWVDLPHQMIDKHSLQDGDLVMARAIASQDHLGKCVVVYPGGQRWAFDSHLMRVRFNRRMIEPEFVRVLLQTPGGRRLFLEKTRRSAVQFNINTKEFMVICIPVPPLDLQRAFSSRLTDLQSIITQQERAAAASDQLVNSLMGRMLAA